MRTAYADRQREPEHFATTHHGLCKTKPWVTNLLREVHVRIRA
ncbi:deoxyribodipyrimidine photolyase [Candidatus Brocadia sinica JPN1]|uniref:Deoxyribodipyrimidine photolyase n=1 Tax=Candidatus Brocadia sinica JPN1 TaxID=1197129 RepID=A0ABQ0K1T2_9BACT|nr:deoxyribodipyrimidine photolyase [Candidatus Brocadia sinica JPN1]